MCDFIAHDNSHSEYEGKLLSECRIGHLYFVDLTFPGSLRLVDWSLWCWIVTKMCSAAPGLLDFFWSAFCLAWLIRFVLPSEPRSLSSQWWTFYPSCCYWCFSFGAFLYFAMALLGPHSNRNLCHQKGQDWRTKFKDQIPMILCLLLGFEVKSIADC